MKSSQTPLPSNFVSVASVVRPWTPFGDLTLHEALDYFGRWHFGQEWTGMELFSLATDARPFQQPYGVIEPRAHVSPVSEDGGGEPRNVRIVGANLPNLLTQTEANEWLAKVIPQLKQAWDAKRAARVRYDKAVSLMRQIMFDQGIAATVLTQHGHRVAVPTSVWGHAAAPHVFSTGRTSFMHGNTYFPAKVEGQVLISRKELEAFIGQFERSTGQSAVPKDDTTEPTEGQKDAAPPPSSSAAVTATEPTNTQEDAAEAGVAVVRDAGGRPRKWDWEAMWVEMCVIGFDEGFPKTRADLAKLMETHFVDTTGNSPAVSEIRKRSGLLFARLNRDEN